MSSSEKPPPSIGYFEELTQIDEDVLEAVWQQHLAQKSRHEIAISKIIGVTASGEGFVTQPSQDHIFPKELTPHPHVNISYLSAKHHGGLASMEIHITAAPPPPKAEPPAIAEFLATAIIPKKRRDAILGDLDERFARDCLELGANRARLRYCGCVVSSVGPLLWSRTKKIRAFALFEIARKIIGF